MMGMGTRGTLHVYLNDELKVRQYNQYDSYPTGQFKDICDFLSNEDNLCRLADRLKVTRFFTKEEFEEALKYESTGICKSDYGHIRKVTSILFLMNRDYGSNILNQIICMCRNLDMDEYPKYRFAIPDWTMAPFEGEELDKEEGNYEIRIRTGPEELKDGEGYKVHFVISGDWHGLEHEFPEDYIPTQKEIEEWEQEDNYN